MPHSIFEQRPWLQPLTLPHAPIGMLGEGEAAMFHLLAKEVFSGRGTIIDAGSFVGKSAYFLASGLRANPKFVAGRDKVHCFDLFHVNHGTTIDFFKKRLNREIRMGESTRAVFAEQVAPVSDLLEVYEGDLHVPSWPSQPIEILMIDIAKSASLGSRVAELFFPHLIPGVSYVIHQDYHHPWHPHIHVAMSYLAEYFELVVPRVDSSAVFFSTKRIPDEVLQRVIRNDFSCDEQLELMDAALRRLPASDRHLVELARAVLHGSFFDADRVLTEVDGLARRYTMLADDPDWAHEISQVRDHFIDKDGWQQVRLDRFDIALKRAEDLLARKRSGHSARRLRGAALRGLGRWTEAEDALRDSLAADPRSGFSYLELADLLAAIGRIDEAEAELLSGLHDRSALDVMPHHYLERLGKIWWQHGDVDRVKAVMDDLRATMEHEAEFWVIDAYLHVRLGQRAQGLASLRKAEQRGVSAPRRSDLAKHFGITQPEWDEAG